jgi:hypothetical protein
MANRKAIIVTSSVVALASLALVSVAAPQARAGNFLQDLAAKFGIKHEQVQQFRQEHREQNQAEHLQKLTTRLDQAVKDGKLTVEQKNMILAKVAEMQNFHDSLKGKSPQQRREALKQKHEELKKWAEDNHIPAPFALGGHIEHPMMRHMMRQHRR